MSKKYKALILVMLFGLLALAYVFISQIDSTAILNPQGLIAQKQRDLIIVTSMLSLLIIIPVFFMAFYFAWKYREGNAKEVKYQPDWDHSALAETVWWAVPTIIILILAGITWTSSHDLDPFKSIQSKNPELTVQVVALDWKWLFIYPEQKIASVNYVQFPQNTPVRFEITSDAPMNSFWIPQLGGQIYAMSGMTTDINLMASNTGSFRGSSANISGRGFAGMHFTAKSTSQADFNKWVNSTKKGQSVLTQAQYQKLAVPSQNNPVKIYSDVDYRLFDTIVMKYMSPGAYLPTASGVDAL